MKGGLSKRWSLTRGKLIWDIPTVTTFVVSKVSLTKEVVFHEGGFSEGVLL